MMQGINLGFQNVITKGENRFNNSVFKTAQKDVTKQEVRNADWGLSAAQSCLARDLVTANPEEAGLIMEKMEFIQSQMNKNLKVDSDIYSQTTSDKCGVITAKGDAKAKKADLVRAYGDSAGHVINEVSNLAENTVGVIKEISPGEFLNIVS